MFIQALILSFSLSLDAFGIGAAYQIKGVFISWKAKIVIGVMTMLLMYGSFLMGNLMMGIFDVVVMRIIGSCFLFIMGCVFIRNSIFGKGEADCDFDRSQTIDISEAAVLAVFLSADSLSAGCACVAIDMDSMLIPLMVGVMNTFFIYFGQCVILRTGKHYILSHRNSGILSGVILIVMALLGLT